MRVQQIFDRFFDWLFISVTQPNASSHIVRFALVFLDCWQAMVILAQTTWIENLSTSTNIQVDAWKWFLCMLAVLAVFSMLLRRQVWLSVIVLAANTILYLIFFIAAALTDPPRSSAGFALFVTLISFSAFLRVFLAWIRERTIRKSI